jgi:hypothetical protein
MVLKELIGVDSPGRASLWAGPVDTAGRNVVHNGLCRFARLRRDSRRGYPAGNGW